MEPSEIDAVLACGAEERVRDTALPVDERSVTIDGDDVEAAFHVPGEPAHEAPATR